jgi:hypothetical protein
MTKAQINLKYNISTDERETKKQSKEYDID